MNITEKELARRIVQHIVNELEALRSFGDLEWKINPEDKNNHFRSWAEMTMKTIVQAKSPEMIYVGQFDGSAKPNPGEMKIGGYIKSLANMDKKLFSFSLDRGQGTNNKAEYLALIFLIESAINRGIKRINIYGDSKLAIMQVNGKWKANKNMAPLRDKAIQLLKQFDHWSLSHVPRSLNSEADSLTR